MIFFISLLIKVRLLLGQKGPTTDEAEGYSLPQKLEKALKAGYFLVHNTLLEAPYIFSCCDPN